MDVFTDYSAKVLAIKNSKAERKVINFIVVSILAVTSFLLMIHGSWAADSKDLLAPGDATVKATFGEKSSIITWLLIGEVVTGILTYILSKNIKVLFGVIVLSVFINIAFAIIG